MGCSALTVKKYCIINKSIIKLEIIIGRVNIDNEDILSTIYLNGQELYVYYHIHTIEYHEGVYALDRPAF